MVYAAYSIMCLIFGTTFLAIKWGIDAGMAPFMSGGIRFFSAGMLLLGFLAVRRKKSFSLLLRKEMLLTGLGLTFGTFACLYWSEQYLPSGMAAVLSATGPLMILLLQTVFLRTKPQALAAAGCILGFAGVVLLLLPGGKGVTGPYGVTAGLVILIGEICYAGGALYSKHVTPRFKEFSPMALNAAQMTYGGAGLLLVSAFTEPLNIHPLAKQEAVYSLLYLICFGSMIASTLFYWLVVKTTPLFPTTWLYISPVLALGLGVAAYGEALTWNMAAGVVIIVFGLLLMNFPALIRRWLRPQSQPLRHDWEAAKVKG